MARKIEFGAGVAAGVLALVGILALLFAPIRYCTVRTTGTCPAGKLQTASLFHFLQLYSDASIWIFLVVMLLLMLAGAGGAVAEARYGMRWGAIALWSGAILAFMGCAFFIPGAVLFFLPALIALAIAGYSSIFQRRLARRPPLPPAADSSAQSGQSGYRS